MTIQAQAKLRSRKLGVLIRDARVTARWTLQETAHATGVTPGIFRSWEEGRRSPSLPELELLAFSLKIPLERFWSKDTTSNKQQFTENLNLPMVIGIRQRLTGALLRQMREKANMSLSALYELSGISIKRLRSFELGERPIPLPELEGLTSLLNGQIEKFFDQAGQIGFWMAQEKAIQQLLKFPVEIRDFICKPINQPYLELAMKLSSMSTDKLRSVAEDILDITI